jgi:hypothetical protein
MRVTDDDGKIKAWIELLIGAAIIAIVALWIVLRLSLD